MGPQGTGGDNLLVLLALGLPALAERLRQPIEAALGRAMLPTRSNKSSAFCGVICVTTQLACSAARCVQNPSTTRESPIAQPANRTARPGLEGAER